MTIRRGEGDGVRDGVEDDRERLLREAREGVRQRRERDELERREAEAIRVWRENPRARAEFARQVGAVEHADWQGEIRRAETAAGRIEGTDFGIEYRLKHPDGRPVRLDYVDLRGHQIVDRKPAMSDDTVLEVSEKYERQHDRHVEAYRSTYGVNPEYYYSFYPSTRGLDKKTLETSWACGPPPRHENPRGERLACRRRFLEIFTAGC